MELLFLISILAVAFLIWYSVRMLRWFKYDKRNPYRRYCKKCGQVQVQMCWDVESWNDPANNWWEDMMPVPDEKCGCHSFSDYRG